MQARLAGCEIRSSPSWPWGAVRLPKAWQGKHSPAFPPNSGPRNVCALLPLSICSKTKIHISDGKKQGKNSCPSPKNTKTTQGSVQTLVSPAFSCSKEMGTNPFWLKDGFQERCGEAERFYSEPHLIRSPAHACFPRPCFNFSGMTGGEGQAMEPSFLGGCFLAP